MAVPTINAIIDFTTGPSFAEVMILDEGYLDVNILSASNSVVVDVSSQVSYVSTDRGRNALANEFLAGNLKLNIIDQNGDFNPQNPASPYYELLTPMKKVKITATYLGVTYPIYSGFITSYVTSYPKEADQVAYTTITAVDAQRLAQNAQISTVIGATAGDLSGTRINQILDEISWPATMRDVDPGLTTLQADPGTTRTSLAALQTVTNTEYGAFYVNASGSFVFQDRSVTAGSIAGSPTVFADNGTGIGYANTTWIINDVLIFNDATITRVGGTPQSSSNQASIDKYFKQSYYLDNLLMQTDAVALDLAQAFVATNAETSIRCNTITLDLHTPNYDTGVIAALSLDFFNPIKVITTQPGGSTIEKTLQIFGTKMEITPNTWKTTFTTLEPILEAFILNDTVYGTLDYNVLSY